MARNTTPIIIVTVLLGVLALGLTFFVLSSGGGGDNPQPNTATAQPTPEPPRQHWVAGRTIYPRTIITRDMMVPSENSNVPADAIADPQSVIGQIASRTIRQGEVITAQAVTSPVARVIPANIPIPVGLRGVAVWVNPNETAAGLVDVGDRVDVIAAHDLTIEKQGGQIIVGAAQFTAGRTIAQDLEVLAVDRSITQYRPVSPTPPEGQPGATPGAAQPGATPAPGAAAPAAEAPAPPANAAAPVFTRVILAASPADAQRIVAANKNGELHLTIRNPASRERLVTAEAREYPSRVVGRPTSAGGGNTGGGGGGSRGGGNDSGPSGPPIPWPQQGPSVAPATPVIPTPNTGGSGPGMYGPRPSTDKEVTVIRGTEKTRVIVPR